MADWTRVVESLATGLLTGGVSTLATILAAFRDIRKRLTDLEARVNVLSTTFGTPGDFMCEASGLFEIINTVKQTLERLRREIANWEDTPPTWAMKLVQRAERASVVIAEDKTDFEERISNRIRVFQDRIERTEDDLKHCQGNCSDRYVSSIDYENDGAIRKQELNQLKLNLASTNGILQGIMAAMNIIDTSTPPEGRKTSTK